MKRILFALGVLVVGLGTALFVGACGQNPGKAAAEVHVDVTDNGFEPAEVKAPAGRAFTLVMTRRTDKTCATEVEFASLKQKYALPLNQPVRIPLPASQPGTLNYECGMGMLEGKVVLR